MLKRDRRQSWTHNNLIMTTDYQCHQIFARRSAILTDRVKNLNIN
ncbi:hypothetical protein HMPREF3226_00182 [Prevotella corporis]|uniref:Uncharacterized protein n=1 Tax=Prevotella corporis TaxID=28128 RepID=A0A133QN13_9BACT|nr:hypothetical protein HMPREF3226_00182 [Prevotella corporis]